MTTRLDLALREVADAAGTGSPLADADAPGTTALVEHLTARVRRRRAVRTATTGAVAACVAAAVALVVPQLTREVTPAGDPDAAPGQCRSGVQTLPSGAGDALEVALGHRLEHGVAQVAEPDAGEDLGSWRGRSADVMVSVATIPDAGVGTTRLRLLVTQDDAVVAMTDEVLSLTPTSTSDVRESFLVPPAPEGTADVDVYPLEGVGEWWDAQDVATGGPRAAQGVALGLVGCRGTGPLPPGVYQVWATTVDSVGTARGAAGPWDLTVAEGEAEARALPDGFPDVPLLPGRLVAAHRHGTGWAAEVVAPGAGRGQQATALLAAEAERVGGLAPDEGVTATWPRAGVGFTQAGVALPGWTVRAVASQTPGGEPSVVYIIAPRP